jgi:ribosomal protein S4
MPSVSTSHARQLVRTIHININNNNINNINNNNSINISNININIINSININNININNINISWSEVFITSVNVDCSSSKPFSILFQFH